jgi:hypothetical protein
MPRTAKQVLAEQNQQTERDRQQLATRKPTTPASALPDTRNDHEKYLDEIAPSGVVGRLVKFSKGGEYIYLDNDEKIGPDEDFVALLDQTLISWVRFHEGEPPERIGGLLYQGFVLPPRQALGDNDKADWPVGLSGDREDVWKHEIMIVLKKPATQELLTFTTTSKTGRRAVGNLLRHYERLQKTDPGAFPVVRLRPGGFNHSDPRIGWVPTPTFVVVGVTPGHTAAVPDTSVKAQLNDQIPF